MIPIPRRLNSQADVLTSHTANPHPSPPEPTSFHAQKPASEKKILIVSMSEEEIRQIRADYDRRPSTLFAKAGPKSVSKFSQEKEPSTTYSRLQDHSTSHGVKQINLMIHFLITS